MDLKTLKNIWTKLGETDPLWAILSFPEKKNGKWDIEEFFATGEREIFNDVLEKISNLDFPLKYGRALDFGCGVGRLTQPLSRRFEEVHGVDIASSMIELANRFNKNPERCIYHFNDSEDLKIFNDNSFDFIYSNIVLQHMKPVYSKGYIREFIRVIKTGGLAVFQIPGELAPRQLPAGQSYIKEELPSSAFKAHISLDIKSLKLEENEKKVINVKVKNLSNVNWPYLGAPDGRYWIQVGNHWLRKDGEVFQMDDGRERLPVDLKPGEATEVKLSVTSPNKKGKYFLELDLVQEWVAWFKDKGSSSVKIPVKVLNESLFKKTLKKGSNYDLKSDVYKMQDVPIIEMYGVRKNEVIEVIENNNGQIIAIHDNGSAGKEWISFRYYVTK